MNPIEGNRGSTAWTIGAVTLTALTGTAAAFYSLEDGSVRLGFSRNLHILAVCVCFKGWLRVYYGLDLSLKGHGNEADFLGFLQKSVRHRFLTLNFEPF